MAGTKTVIMDYYAPKKARCVCAIRETDGNFPGGGQHTNIEPSGPRDASKITNAEDRTNTRFGDPLAECWAMARSVVPRIARLGQLHFRGAPII